MMMQTLTEFFSWSGAGGALAKITALLAVTALAFWSMRRLEPRWKVKIARAVLLLIPILVFAHFWAPRWEVPVAGYPTKEPSAKTLDIAFGAERMQLDETLSNSEAAWGTWLVMAWLLIALGLLICEMVRLRRMATALRIGMTPSRKLAVIWDQISAEQGLAGCRLCVLPEEQSPFIALGWRPVVAVPQSFDTPDSGNEENVIHALRHEAAHLAAADRFWMPLMRIAACVFWFHPLIWWLAASHLRACEEACDAEAARKGGVESYRQALAQMALDLVPLRQPAAATFLRMPTVLKRIRRVAETTSLRPPTWKLAIPVLFAVTIFGGAVGVFQVIAAEEKKGDDSARLVSINRQNAKLEKIVIPELKFQEESLDEILLWLSEKTAELDNLETDANQKGLKFVFESDANEAKTIPITLNLRNVPAGAVVQYLAQLAGLKFSVQPNGISFQLLEALPNTIPGKLNKIIIPSIEFNDTSLEDAIRFLQQKSVELDEETDPAKKGVNMVIQLDSDDAVLDTPITLKLTNVPLLEALRYTTELADCHFRAEEHAVVVVEGAADPADVPSAAVGDMQEKLNRIVIPRLEFKDTPLADALKFLQQRGVELDDTEADRAKKGFNLILRARGEGNILINLRLHNIPMSEALRYTTKLAGLRFIVEEQGVVVLPAESQGEE